MKKMAVITATRAEFGLLMPVIRELRKFENDDFAAELVVTGTHLYTDFGHTADEIKASGLRIDKYVTISVKSGCAQDISENQADALVKFTRLFSEQQYDAAVLLGDRYETLMFAIAAGNTHTPIFHLCGGDTTEGAVDEWIRHSITKMSYLHFVTNAESQRRVIQLGESPQRVFSCGSTSIDNIISSAGMSKIDALHAIGLEDCDYAICTYHPATMDPDGVDQQIEEFLSAVRLFPEIEFIMTKSNADQGGAHINELLEMASAETANLHIFSSLGPVRYLSLMKHAKFVLGNSSSGIIEAPALKVPTVNIGDRQRGRLQSESVINCGTDKKSIVGAIVTALSQEFRAMCQNVISPYGDGHAAERIAAKMLENVLGEKIDLKKTFYDIDKR